MNTNASILEGKRICTLFNKEHISSRQGLERAMEEKIILEGIAGVCREDMSLCCELGGIKGIIPRNEVAYSGDGSDIKDIAVITRVGKAVCFRVMGVGDDENGEICALLSRKEAQLDCLRNYICDLCPGDIIPARITHMEHFGAFADIGCGLVSLMPIDAISVSRISHPSDRFTLGQTLDCVVKSIDYATGRVYLTHRELLGTWEQNALLFSAGQTVEGIVRSVEDYGIFVELTPNLAGLAEYTDGVNAGDSVTVFIKSIIPDKMKIKLVIINTYSDSHPEKKMKYFISGSEHVSYWRYSPDNCNRVIESVFD